MTATRDVVDRLEEAGLDPRWEGSPPDRLAGITDDSRSVDGGDLFCAIPGFRVDGHDFLTEAARGGAVAALVERVVPDVRLPQLVVGGAREGTALAAPVFHGDPSRSVRVFGVTGTNGKTTSAWLLRHILSAGSDAASVGTLGVVAPGGECEARDLTTPGPVEATRTLATLRDRGVRSVAMEVSSHALDQRRVDGIEFAAVVFTNLSREHLDYHPDMAAYRDAKLRAETLVREGDGVCVVNADEPAWREVGRSRPRLTYGVSGEADVRAEELEVGLSGSRWRLVHGDAAAEVTFPLPGRFNVANALGAAATGLHAGLPVKKVARRLGTTPQVPGRMEVIRREPGLVVRDYAHTPDALERVLRGLRPRDGRLIVVFGCGGDRDPGKRPLMGRAAARLADLAIVTTDNPRSEDPAEIAAAVADGLDADVHEVILDRRAAIARALELAGGDDVVLLAGKGHETYQICGDRKEPFDEARIVEELTGASAEASDDGGGGT